MWSSRLGSSFSLSRWFAKVPHQGLKSGPSVYKTDALALSYRGACHVSDTALQESLCGSCLADSDSATCSNSTPASQPSNIYIYIYMYIYIYTCSLPYSLSGGFECRSLRDTLQNVVVRNIGCSNSSPISPRSPFPCHPPASEPGT